MTFYVVEGHFEVHFVECEVAVGFETVEFEFELFELVLGVGSDEVDERVARSDVN